MIELGDMKTVNQRLNELEYMLEMTEKMNGELRDALRTAFQFISHFDIYQMRFKYVKNKEYQKLLDMFDMYVKNDYNNF